MFVMVAVESRVGFGKAPTVFIAILLLVAVETVVIVVAG